LHQGRGCQKCANDSRSKAKTIHVHDHSFFSVPNLTNSYWAGFIAADGNVPDERHLYIKLSAKDSGHLEKFHRDIGYTGPVYYGEREAFGKMAKHCSTFLANAERVVYDLEHNFNITQRKSLTLLPPTGLKDSCSLAYLKGYIDGDGHLKIQPPRYRIGACGTEQTLTWIKEWFDRLSPSVSANGLISSVRKMYTANTFYYEVGAGRAERIIASLRTIKTPHLHRKWECD